MPLTKEKKEDIVKDLQDKIAKQKTAIFVNFKGMKAQDFLKLRGDLRKNDSSFVITKKTLADIAFKSQGLEIKTRNLDGELGIIFGFADQIAPAKTVFDFSKIQPNLKIVGGVLEGQLKSTNDMIELAKLPSREELLARLVGTIQAPISGFVNVLQGNIRGLVYALNEIKNNK